MLCSVGSTLIPRERPSKSLIYWILQSEFRQAILKPNFVGAIPQAINPLLRISIVHFIKKPFEMNEQLFPGRCTVKFTQLKLMAQYIRHLLRYRVVGLDEPVNTWYEFPLSLVSGDVRVILG